MKNFISELLRQRAELHKAVEEIAEQATVAAVSAAAAKTPPTDVLRGTKTLTGELKAHWATDSVTKPVRSGKTLITTLGNNMQYASYVNDGHRMDRHFVPGLYINPFSGELEYDEQRKNDVGIMVGTKTDYVEGLFMAEAGEEAYEKACEELSKKLEDIIK
jgi:hypothetical protein